MLHIWQYVAVHCTVDRPHDVESFPSCLPDHCVQVTLQLFYRVHIVGFLVLVTFANMHFNRVWLWVFPGAHASASVSPSLLAAVSTL
jgi:hypothetical protein